MTNLQGWESEQSSSALVSRKTARLYTVPEAVPQANLPSFDAVGACLQPCQSSCLQRSMKTMTCKELGGPCDQKLSAGSWEDMVNTMVQHVMTNHPQTAEEMKKMHEQDPKKWGRETKPKWDAAPEA
jgi:predicted small metal-binding protein